MKFSFYLMELIILVEIQPTVALYRKMLSSVTMAK